MTTTPRNQFPSFSSLPYELRFKIYGMLLNEPRLLTITCEKATVSTTNGNFQYIKSYTSPTPIPPLLHICHESRVEALTHYKPLFRTKYSPSYIYVNFTTDSIKLADGMLPYLFREKCEGIREMKIVIEDTEYYSHF